MTVMENSGAPDSGRGDRLYPASPEAVARQLDQYRARLRRAVELRLDPRLRGRVDASDVVQEALVEAVERYSEYEEREGGSLYLWLRFLAQQRLLQLRRYHLEAARRSVCVERRIDQQPASSNCDVLAERIVASTATPSSICSRQETRARVLRAVESLDPLDREILALRYFEELSNGETAQVLGVPESTASTRFLRALRKIKRVLELQSDWG